MPNRSHNHPAGATVPAAEGGLSTTSLRSAHLAITTCNRPLLLGRLLADLTRQPPETVAYSGATVFDDSDRSEVCRETRSIVERVAADTGAKLMYIGPVEKRYLIDELMCACAADGIPREILEFALERQSEFESATGYGRNRNAELLVYAGRRLLSLDDDAAPEFFKVSGTARGLALRSMELALQVGHFDSEKALQRQLEAFQGNGFREMDVLLGRNLSETLAELERHGHRVDRTGASTDLQTAVRNRSASIRAVMAGVAGSRWFNRPSVVMSPKGSLRGVSLRNRQSYLAAKVFPFSVIQACQLTITDTPFLMAGFSGLDARELVPSFPPAGRTGDSCWVELLRVCDPGAMIAHLPFVIRHESAAKRPFSEAELHDTSADLGLLTLLTLQHLQSSVPALTGAPALEAVGRRLIELGSLGQNDWLEFHRMIWLEHAAGTTRRFERLLEEHHGRPRFWAAEVRAHLDRLQTQATDPPAALPRELEPQRDLDAACRLHRLFVRRHGELLTAWPVIWNRAAALRLDKGPSAPGNRRLS